MTESYAIFVGGQKVATMTADFAQASSPLLLDGDSTPYQVADARHRPLLAAELLLSWCWSQGGALCPMDGDGDPVGEIEIKDEYTGWTVRYGFLDGNLPENADAERYATLIEEALAERFPGASIEVPHQNACGCRPVGLRPAIYRDADGEEEPRADEILSATVEGIAMPYRGG